MDLNVILLSINALLLGGLMAWLYRQRLELRTLQDDCVQLQIVAQSLPEEARALIGTERPLLLSIEILNPMQVAAEKSWLAGALGTLTPNLVRRLVYERTQEVLQQEVLKHGLEAEVRLHGA